LQPGQGGDETQGLAALHQPVRVLFQRLLHGMALQLLHLRQLCRQPGQQGNQRIHQHLVPGLQTADALPGAVEQSLPRTQQFVPRHAGTVAVDFQVDLPLLAQGAQRIGQGVVELLFGGRLAPRVEAGLADEPRGDHLHQPLLQLQQAAARQRQAAPQFHLAGALRQLRKQCLVQLHFQVKQATRAAVQTAQCDAAVHQAHRVKGALLHDAQQQGQLVPLHAAGHRQQHLIGLACLPVQLLQVGVHQVAGVPGGPQGWLQGLGAQLPPVAGIDIARLQPGAGPGLAAEFVLLPGQQGVAGAAQVVVAAPQLQVAVADVQ
jgi:hypothetical protein